MANIKDKVGVKWICRWKGGGGNEWKRTRKRKRCTACVRLIWRRKCADNAIFHLICGDPYSFNVVCVGGWVFQLFGAYDESDFQALVKSLGLDLSSLFIFSCSAHLFSLIGKTKRISKRGNWFLIHRFESADWSESLMSAVVVGLVKWNKCWTFAYVCQSVWMYRLTSNWPARFHWTNRLYRR